MTVSESNGNTNYTWNFYIQDSVTTVTVSATKICCGRFASEE